MSAPTIAVACRQLDDDQAQLTLIRDAFTAAVGFYYCPCGSEFEFTEHSDIEDYAALNRWLGRHHGNPLCETTP